MVAQAGHDVIGGERLDDQVPPDLDPCADRQRDHLVAILRALEALGGGDQRRQWTQGLFGAEDPGVGVAMLRALGQHPRQAKGMIEMAMGEEQVLRSGELRRAAPRIERQARRVDAEPGLLARHRPPFDPQLSQFQLDRTHQGVFDAPISLRGMACLREGAVT